MQPPPLAGGNLLAVRELDRPDAPFRPSGSVFASSPTETAPTRAGSPVPVQGESGSKPTSVS